MILETTALLCLSANIYFEARGEDIAGQIAVAEVVLNRVFVVVRWKARYNGK